MVSVTRSRDPQLQRWRGFAQQVVSAAAQFRSYFDEAHTYNIKVGQPMEIDNIQVTPANQSTANLYIYTPHVQGNTNFGKIWNGWFGPATSSQVRIHLPYPDGSLLQLQTSEEDSDQTPSIWFIKDGTRKEILSRSVLASRFDASRVLIATKEDLEKYPVGKPITFHQYALVRDEEENLYLIVDDTKRLFTSSEVFRSIGYNPEEIIEATSSEL